MELVEELAFGVVQDYREQQKGRLKRTFVSAADAAGAKVNRSKNRKICRSDLILVKQAFTQDENAIHVLTISAAFSRLALSFSYSTCNDQTVNCSLRIGDDLIYQGQGNFFQDFRFYF